MYKYATCVKSPVLKSRICLLYMIKMFTAPFLDLSHIWELGTRCSQADASSLDFDSRTGDSKQQGWRRIRSGRGTPAVAAASGFQWQQRQLFHGRVQCPASKDSALQIMSSVLGGRGNDFTKTVFQSALGVVLAQWFIFPPLLLKLV